VAIICAFYGRSDSQANIARWLGTTEIGTPARNINRLEGHGFRVVYQEGSLQFLIDALERGTPCVVFLRTGDLPYWTVDTAHAVVLVGLAGEQAYLHDPFFSDAPKVVPLDALMLAWSSFDYAVSTLVPTA
jgi:ABC-type bacteriocin/lantibiotic exporter with double-glycine peptidase domain